jgi:hypothetical protein
MRLILLKQALQAENKTIKVCPFYLFRRMILLRHCPPKNSKKMKNEEKKRIYPEVLEPNPSAERTYLRGLLSIESSLNELIEIWNGLAIGPIPGGPNGFNSLIASPEKTVRQALIRETENEIPRGGRFPVNHEKYLDSLVLPDMRKIQNKAETVRAELSDRLALYFYWDADTCSLKRKNERWLRHIYQDSLVLWNSKDAVLYDFLNYLIDGCNLMQLPVNARLHGQLLDYDSTENRWGLNLVRFKKFSEQLRYGYGMIKPRFMAHLEDDTEPISGDMISYRDEVISFENYIKLVG